MATHGCFLLQPSSDTRLWFSTASDYLKHLISNGVRYAGTLLQVQGPLASQLRLEQPPLQPESLGRGDKELFFAPSTSQTAAKKRSTTSLRLHIAEDQKNLSGHLLCALSHGLVQGVQQVLERSPDTDLSAALPCTNDQELPPLAVAALLPSAQCLELLIAKGAPVNATDSRGRTPLHWAVIGGRLAAVRTLLKHSAVATSEDEQGLTPLLCAAMTGAQGIAAALLKAGAPADQQHASTGVTALSLACLLNQPEVAKLLLKHRATPSLADCRGCLPLHCAVWGGSRRCVKLLLSQSPALLAGRDHIGRTPLLYAAAKGDAVMCQHLLKKGAQVTEGDSGGRTAVHWAVMSSQVPCLEAVLECASAVTVPDLCNQADNHGAVPAHYAAMMGECEILSALQNKGASLSAVDTDGHSPLIWAAACGHENTLKQLLEHNERDSPSLTVAGTLTPLHVAARVGAVEVCRVLTQHSQEAVSCAGPDGMTPLHWASCGGHTHCVAELVGAGAVVDCATPTGQRTSLHLASLQGHGEAAEKLLECGASPELAMEPGGERPIHLAAVQGHRNVLEALLNYGCAPDMKQHNDGHTPLHIAASMGHLSCCRLLVERGADVSVRETTVESHTALDLAMLGGHDEVASYLISRSAPSGGGRFHRAALTIQAVWRLHRHRRRRCATEHWCAVVMQRAVRQWLRERRAQRVREARHRTRHRAAAAIQRQWGSYREKKRRYEASSARLRSRLQQEHLAASLLLEELQAQAHSIQLPSTPRVMSFTSPVPRPLPGYLLQASAPPPPPLFPSASLLFPAKPRRPLRRRAPHITVAPSTVSKPPSLPAVPESREGSSVAVGGQFPPIPTQPSLTATPPSEGQSKVPISRSSRSSRPAGSTEPRKKLPSCPGPSKPSRGRAAGSRSEQQVRPLADHTPTQTSTQTSMSLPAIANGGVVSSEGGGGGGRVGRSAQPLPSPATAGESLAHPPGPADTGTSEDTERDAQVERELLEKEEEGRRDGEVMEEEEEGRRDGEVMEEEESEERPKEELKEEPQEKGKEGEEGEEGEEQTLSVAATPRKSYMRETVFMVAPLGHRAGRRVGGRGEQNATSSGQEGPPAAGRAGLLGHIQRYDRLDHVLSLLQRAQGEGGGEVRLGDLRQHIKTALDEAVRLRADTEALQHEAMLKMKSTTNSTNSVKT